MGTAALSGTGVEPASIGAANGYREAHVFTMHFNPGIPAHLTPYVGRCGSMQQCPPNATVPPRPTSPRIRGARVRQALQQPPASSIARSAACECHECHSDGSIRCLDIYLRQQQCGKPRAIAWEMALNETRSHQVNTVLSVAHQPTTGYRQNAGAACGGRTASGGRGNERPDLPHVGRQDQEGHQQALASHPVDPAVARVVEVSATD